MNYFGESALTAFQSRIDEYKRLLEEARQGSGEALMEALEIIPEVVSEVLSREVSKINERLNNINNSINELRASLEKLLGEVRDLRTHYEELADRVRDLSEEYDKMNKRLSRIEVNVGGLTEALLPRIVVEELAGMGYMVKEKRRNKKLDGEDIDLLVVAVKDGVESHFLVEVKVKPSHADVGALLAKADLYEARVGVRPVPVLAGVWIGGEVEAYARSRGVLVVSL